VSDVSSAGSRPSPNDLLDIAEVASRSGLSPSALRFYELKGLIAPRGRLGLRRQYAPSVVTRLAFVLAASEAGLQLDEIAALLGGVTAEQEFRRRLLEKRGHLRQQIDRLTTIHEHLGHASICSAPRLLECPAFSAGIRSFLSDHPVH
jgi:DNA-binding transcriptional MerR regulator